ncbi:MAG: SRPBCC domain-containing protein [Alphaproteobacteria bacterium]
MEGAAKFITPNCVQYERLIAAPASAVWPLLGTPEGLARWFIPTARFDPKRGGQFHFMEGWEGKISLYAPERVISFFPDEGGETTFECVADGAARTRFILTDRQAPGFVPPDDIPMDPAAPRKQGLYQPGGPGTPWVGILVGWHHFADDFVAAVTGGETQRPPLGPLHDFYQGRLRDYFA